MGAFGPISETLLWCYENSQMGEEDFGMGWGMGTRGSSAASAGAAHHAIHFTTAGSNG